MACGHHLMNSPRKQNSGLRSLMPTSVLKHISPGVRVSLGIALSPQEGDVAQLVERRTGTPLRQVRFPGATRDLSPRVNFQCRLSYGVRTALVCNRMF